jgi:L-ascorbate metabolism protein UlaG (beta-lactamase superfamily)
MKRRQLIRYGSISILTTLSAIIRCDAKAIAFRNSLAQNGSDSNSGSVTIQYLGHTCFLFTGNGLKVLVNPFRSLGCTAGYNPPKVEADLVLVSSFLLDEGAVENLPGNPQIFTEPGDYQTKGVKFQGITTPHDREGGRRFGNNIAWRWNQGGINILHLGGAAAPISLEEKILMGTPDVLLLPVGGGAKSYNPTEAKGAVDNLKPKVVIPTQYRTEAADKANCDLVSVDEFLALSKEIEIKKLNVDRIAIKLSDLPQDKTVIRVLEV